MTTKKTDHSRDEKNVIHKPTDDELAAAAALENDELEATATLGFAVEADQRDTSEDR